MKRRDFCGATLLGGAALTIPDSVLASAATPINTRALTALTRGFGGTLMLPDHAEYDTARRVWNPMHDKRPALIARCANAADVAAAVRFAREQQLLLAVRSGGHSFPGYSTCDGGMMIDLSALREVRIDADKLVATVAPGAWVSDVDTPTQKLGLATTMGQISDTGVSGLTLGGGYGWLSRKFGLACDNLLAANLVTADGKSLRVSADENPDLFWAIRGGGGNFGVVTSFEYRLHVQSPQMYGAYIAWPVEHAAAVTELYQQVTATGPRELSLDLSIEASDSGAPLVALYACHSGDPAAGPALMAPFERIAKPFQSVHGPASYERVQHQSDGPHLSKNLHYIKAGLIKEFKPGLVDFLRSEFKPSPNMFVYLQNASGAVGDVDPGATAFWNRKSMANLMILGAWKDPADTERHRAAIRAAWEKIAPFAEGFYTNLSDLDQSGTHRNYGGNYPRLARIKRQYDPTNLFRLNSNITPQA